MADVSNTDRSESQAQPASPPPERAHARAQAKGEKPYQKAMRPWYKKKRFVVPLGVLALIIVVAVASGGGDGTKSAKQTDTRNRSLYPDRPDRQAEDHEATVGGSVRLAGYTATVKGAEISTNEVLGDRQLTVFVEIENRDDRAQPYNTFHWRLQDKDGRVLDPTLNFRDDDLGSGDLVKGGKASGTVAFDAGPGTYYVIYKPDPFNAARGIWKIEV